MKVAFLSEWGDPFDQNLRSGVPFYIASHLQNLGTEVIPVILEKPKRPILDRLTTKGLSLFYNSFLKGKKGFYFPLRRKSFLKGYAEQAQQLLDNIDFDVLFCPGTLPLAYLKPNGKPIIIWVDATFANYLDYYPGFNLCNLASKEGHQAEKNALAKCNLAVYTSSWAGNSAVHDHGLCPTKLKIIPRGANLTETPNFSEIETLLSAKKYDICHLLFIGSNWERKGGPLVLKVCKQLRKENFPIELHIVGIDKAIIGETQEWMHIYGRLNKSNTDDVVTFNKLLRRSHFLFVPSMAEAFGIVYAEASAYALPSIANKTGGVEAAIYDELNGKLFPPDTGVMEYANYITMLIEDEESYLQLARSSYQIFQNNFLWSANVTKLKEYMEIINEPSGA